MFRLKIYNYYKKLGGQHVCDMFLVWKRTIGLCDWKLAGQFSFCRSSLVLSPLWNNCLVYRSTSPPADLCLHCISLVLFPVVPARALGLCPDSQLRFIFILFSIYYDPTTKNYSDCLTDLRVQGFFLRFYFLTDILWQSIFYCVRGCFWL